MDMMKIRLTIVFAAVTLLLGVGALALYPNLHGHRNFTSQTNPSIRIGGPFSLVDQDGKPVTEQALKGKWTAVFFGYTYCADVCPLTLQMLGRTQKALGDKAKNLQIVFITVDPARDTPSNLKAYLSSGGFPSGVVGLTGTAAQVTAAEKAYRVSAVRQAGPAGSYTFSHTSVIYLMGPDGGFKAPLTDDLSPQQGADQIRDAMANPAG